VAEVLKRSGIVRTRVDQNGDLVLESSTKEGGSSIAVDPGGSTAAAALGLTGGPLRADAVGATPARLVSAGTEPFLVEREAEMRLVVDGRTW